MQKCKFEELIYSSLALRKIPSFDDKVYAVEKAELLLNALLVKKSNPELFSESERLIVDEIKRQLSENEKDLITDVFLAKFCNLTPDPPEYSIETIQKLYEDGLYFTIKEIIEIIDWENTKAEEDVNYDVINFLADALSKGLYFQTLDEADDAMERYEQRRKRELKGNLDESTPLKST